MVYHAKPILKDKFWIVEDENTRVGTLSWDEDRFVFSSASETQFFKNKSQIKAKFGFFVWDKEQKIDKDVLLEVNGYSTSVKPFNPIFDIKRKLPLFTKSEKSKSLYCAGYYIIRFEKGWVKSFCPKLITIERYEYKGPFKTEIEMRQELSRVSN